MAGSGGDLWWHSRAQWRRRVEERPDMWGGCVSDREREKAQQWNTQARKESAFWQMR
jgi:hypothetical protein